MFASEDVGQYLAAVRSRVPLVVAITLFRCLPFLGYTCVSPHVRFLTKLVLVVIAGCSFFIITRTGLPVLPALCQALISLVYFAAAAFFVHRVIRDPARCRFTPPSLLGTLAFVFVVVPAVILPGSYRVTAVGVGWEMMLSGYSYCLDTRSDPSPPSSADAIFFMLVNPVVVYSMRGRRVRRPSVDVWAALRATLGVVVMLGQDAVVIAMFTIPALRFRGIDDIRDLSSYAGFIGSNALQGVGLYCAHSGLASLQIGLMRMSGYEVPERYHLPFLSSGPQDFWRRWNVWIGAWAKLYLFHPMAQWLRRRSRKAASFAIPIAATIVTFLLVGILHDFCRYAAELVEVNPPFSLRVTALFLILGISVVISATLQRTVAIRRLTAGALRPLVRLVGRVLFLQLLCWMTWFTLGRGATQYFEGIPDRIGPALFPAKE